MQRLFSFVHLVGLFGWSFVCPIPVWAGTIDQFPETTYAEAAPCFLKTNDGRSFDLSHICGRSEMILRNVSNRSQSSAEQSSNRAAIINPGFRAAIGANPGNPFGNNPTLNQCYIIDAEGNPCQ